MTSCYDKSHDKKYLKQNTGLYKGKIFILKLAEQSLLCFSAIEKSPQGKQDVFCGL